MAATHASTGTSETTLSSPAASGTAPDTRHWLPTQGEPARGQPEDRRTAGIGYDPISIGDEAIALSGTTFPGDTAALDRHELAQIGCIERPKADDLLAPCVDDPDRGTAANACRLPLARRNLDHFALVPCC
jgi:hypothetical protein